MTSPSSLPIPFPFSSTAYWLFSATSTRKRHRYSLLQVLPSGLHWPLNQLEQTLEQRGRVIKPACTGTDEIEKPPSRKEAAPTVFITTLAKKSDYQRFTIVLIQTARYFITSATAPHPTLDADRHRGIQHNISSFTFRERPKERGIPLM